MSPTLAARRPLPVARDVVAATIALVTAAAAAARLGLTGETWPAVLAALALTPAALITARTRFTTVVTAGLTAGAAGLAASAVTADGFEVHAVGGAVVGLGLAAAVTVFARLALLRTTAALVDADRRLREQAVRDPITGVANRQGLLLVASPMIDHARASLGGMDRRVARPKALMP